MEAFGYVLCSAILAGLHQQERAYYPKQQLWVWSCMYRRMAEKAGI